MGVPKFKDFIQKLSFLGNYSSLILPVIIMLIGALLFIPTRLMSSKLKKRMADESVSIGKRVESLSKNTVSRNQWEVEQEYQKAYERDANQTALLAKQSSQRELLSYKIFPAPRDTSTLIFKEFGRQFRNGVDGLIARVNALDCPTDAELQRALQGSSLPNSRRSLVRGRSSEVDSTITEVLCREKAESAFVYANPEDLSGYEFWEEYEYTGMDTAIQDCWYWQLAYWIIEDVIDTINVLNAGSNSVFTSSVKRILGVNFTASTTSAMSSGRNVGVGRRQAVTVKPKYVLSAQEVLTESHTGRFCSDDIDVVHFNVVVVVSTKAILPFMQQLCSAKQHKFRGFSGKEQEQVFKHNSITILESKIKSIDRKDTIHESYRYGEDAVVELDLICEYIFNRNGYDEIKPESVKELLKTKE